MRSLKQYAMSLAAVGVLAATSAIADAPIVIEHFFYVENRPAPFADELCVVGPPEASGQLCEIWAETSNGLVQVASFPLLPGLNHVVVADLFAQDYVVSGPQVQGKYVNPGSN